LIRFALRFSRLLLFLRTLARDILDSRKNFEQDKRGFCYLVCRDYTALKASQMLKEGNDKHTAGPPKGSNDNSVATSVTPVKQATALNTKGSNDNSVATSVTPAKQATEPTKMRSKKLSARDGLSESETESEEEVDKVAPRPQSESDTESGEEVEEDAPGVEDLCLQVCQQYLESKQDDRGQGQTLRYGESQYDDAEESSEAAPSYRGGG
jgi:hypothetical protein